jgi:uncharacterized repeat protein (TIGR01451 family)
MSTSLSDIKRVHWLSAILGGLLLLLGIVVVLVPSLASSVPLGVAIIGPVALAALVMGLWRVRVRNNTGIEHVELPTPEVPFALPTPGDDLDEMLYRYAHRGEATLEYPEQIGNRLRGVAVAAIAHREGITQEEALDQLEAGTWTDNQYAAAFFSDEVATPLPSFDERVMQTLGRGEHAYERQVRETVDAIVGIAELVESPEADADETDEGGLLARFRGGQSEEAQESVERSRVSVKEYTDEDEGEVVADGVRYLGTTWTSRWLGVESFALIAAGLGVATTRPALVLVGAVATVYAAYARAGGTPALTGVSVERSLSDTAPAPGEEVDVTVTVENESGTFLPDLRLVDLVPPNVRVIEGSPRLYTALRPGAKSQFAYTVVAERGHHEWPLLAVGGDFAGSVEREAVIDAEGETSFECLPRLRTVSEMPVRAQTTVFAGQVETGIGGSGLEFHSVREYRPNDPMRRVNWKRKARTGELATIDFREEKAATVVLLFDAREGAYVSSAPGERHALDRSVEAASEVYAALSDHGDLVGIAAFDTVPCWLGPGAGDGHDESARQVLAYHPALSSLPPDLLDLEGGYVDPMTHVRRQLPTGTQVMLFSPLINDYPAEVARRLDSAGNRVTIISPDPTADRTAGQRLARVERAVRINRLRERGIRVMDWSEEETIGLSFERASRRWNA